MESPQPFPQLPMEIWYQIFKVLGFICHLESRSTAAFASVCSTWKFSFEPRHFERLFVTRSRAADFGDIVVGRRRLLVKHIRLDVILDDLDLDEHLANTIRPDLDPDVTFANTIGPVFEALSTWDNSAEDDPRQLVLEIWPCRRENRAERRRDVDLPPPAYPTSLFHLPQVRAVTTLLLQQNGRFRPRQDAFLWLLRSLPALEKIGSEKRQLPLTLPLRVERRIPSAAYMSLIENLPTSATELVLFNEPQDGLSTRRWRWEWNSLRADHSVLGFCLYQASRNLRHLSVSFVLDAVDFLRPFYPFTWYITGTEVAETWTWDNLETLALTSVYLMSPKNPHEKINCLLRAASLAARRMPRLRTMELWCGNGDEHGCVFQYSCDRDSGTASLTWKGTWALRINELTADSWRETTRRATGLEAEIRFEAWEIRRPLMMMDVAQFLDLRDRVLTER